VARLAALVVVLIAGLAVTTSPAAAGWRINRAVAIANVVWGNPCPWRIKWDPPLRNHPEALSWASMQGGCRYQGFGVVHLNASEPIHTFDVFCTRVLHEVGHLADAVHSPNPRSVMYPIDQTSEGRLFSRDGRHFHWIGNGGDPRCRDHGRPYLEAHGLL
jgi:hypothetical protein